MGIGRREEGGAVMILDLTEIPGQGLELDHRFELSEEAGGEPSVPAPVRLVGVARPGLRGVELEGRLEAVVRLECSRCIEPYEAELATDFYLIVVSEASEFGVGEKRLEPADATLFYTDRSRVDLREIAREQVVLGLPLKPVCQADCAGLCPTCGANRNRIECSCQPDDVDPRLAPLLALKRKLGGSRS
jgi:uncharacterized protein